MTGYSGSSCSLLMLLQIIAVHVGCEVTLTSNITDVSDGLICPGGVRFTCDAQLNQSTLRWFANNKQLTLAHYTYAGAIHTFPFPPDSPKITILNASLDMPTGKVTFVSILEMRSSWIVDMDINSIQCGSFVDFASLPSHSIRTPPPKPVYTCYLGSDSRSVVFNWSISYNEVNAVDRYSVTPGFPFINCSTCNIMPLGASASSCTCTNLQNGMYNALNVTALNCGDQQGISSTVGINLTKLDAPSSIEVTAIYNQEISAVSEFQGIDVEWKQVDPVIVSGICGYDTTLYYKVVLKQNDGENSTEINSRDCDETSCRIFLSSLNLYDHYTITITSVNAVGQSENATYASSVEMEPSLNASIYFLDCFVYVNCSSSLESESNCEIRFGINASALNLETTPLNQLHQLPLLEPVTPYHLEFSANIESMSRVKISRNFTTGEFHPRILGEHTAMITIGCLSLLMAIASCVASYILVFHSSNCSRSRVIIHVLNLIICIIPLLLWCATALYVGLQRNTCDIEWKNGRNAFIALALLFSVIAAIFITAGSIILCLFNSLHFAKSCGGSKDLVHKEFEEYSTLNYNMSKDVSTCKSQSSRSQQVTGNIEEYAITCHASKSDTLHTIQNETYSHLIQQKQCQDLQDPEKYQPLSHTGMTHDTKHQMMNATEYNHLGGDQYVLQ